MAKIAVALKQALAQRALTGAAGRAVGRKLAHGDGWTVADVVCTSGPQDRAFEEQHLNVSIAIVVAGSFQYQSALGCELMTPGSLLLGNSGQCFECRHEHGMGDRCLSFSYTQDYFDRFVYDAATDRARPAFRVSRLPQLQPLSALVARASAALAGSVAHWEELSLEIAAQAFQLANGVSPRMNNSLPSAISRVTRAVRMIESNMDTKLTLAHLAQEAKLSPYHFLRTFQQLTSLTPHQYILRVRLRETARRMMLEPERILDIALDCGFGDISNFNRVFRAEFGASPRAFKRQASQN